MNQVCPIQFKQAVKFVSAVLIGLAGTLKLYAQSDKLIIFETPATHFTEAFPLGNGRLGAMVFGNPSHERIVLNEISMWSGGVQDADKKDAHHHLPAIRQLLLDGKNTQAQDLLQKNFVSAGAGSGYGSGANVPFGCYQTFGDLTINWEDSLQTRTGYQRQLNLDNAMATSVWSKGKVRFTQEVFVSAPAQAVVVMVKSDAANALNFSLTLNRRSDVTYNTTADHITMSGSLPNGSKEGIRFAGQLVVKSYGGKRIVEGQSIRVLAADSCLLTFTAATDMNWPNVSVRGTNPRHVVAQQQRRLRGAGFSRLFGDHVIDYSQYFQRSSLTLRSTDNRVRPLPDRRKYDMDESRPDLNLIPLYFNFGRYLLISSSRPGTLPANLQGLWAEEYQTPWNGDYHLNINLQMNYWPADITNLSDLQEPLFNFTRQLSKTGGLTAKAYYKARGWGAHVISNPWGFTSPGEGADWGSTLSGGAWLATHIIQSYQYNPDKHFLSRMYPYLKGAAMFYTDILISEQQHGHLVTAPSNSPENAFRMSDGTIANTCMGPTMDMQIGRQLLLGTAFMADELKRDRVWADSLRRIAGMLAPNQISKRTGGIMEWLEDYEETDTQHRHVSQLYGLYPYDEITPWKTPAFAEAARHTLARRGDGGTGWSRAWKIAFYTRLGDGDHAYAMLRALLNPVTVGDNAAGTYPNLFCAHPPFQIDGNFGATAAIAEFFLQSHGDSMIIRLLPALPDNFRFLQGSLKGFRARNGFEIDMAWEKRELTQLKVRSFYTKPCLITLKKKPEKIISDGKEVRYDFHNGLLSFSTTKGKAYDIILSP